MNKSHTWIQIITAVVYMRMCRGANMKEEKFVMRFPSASDAFYSLTCNQNDILYVKLTVLFLQCRERFLYVVRLAEKLSDISYFQ